MPRVANHLVGLSRRASPIVFRSRFHSSPSRRQARRYRYASQSLQPVPVWPRLTTEGRTSRCSLRWKVARSRICCPGKDPYPCAKGRKRWLPCESQQPASSARRPQCGPVPGQRMQGFLHTFRADCSHLRGVLSVDLLKGPKRKQLSKPDSRMARSPWKNFALIRCPSAWAAAQTLDAARSLLIRAVTGRVAIA
jgi:hypothetical protein